MGFWGIAPGESLGNFYVGNLLPCPSPCNHFFNPYYFSVNKLPSEKRTADQAPCGRSDGWRVACGLWRVKLE